MVLANLNYMRQMHREGDQNNGDDTITADENGNGKSAGSDYIKDAAVEHHADKVSGEVAVTRGMADEVLNPEPFFIESLPPMHGEEDYVNRPDVFGSDYSARAESAGKCYRNLFSDALGGQNHSNGVTDIADKDDEEPLTTGLVALADNISLTSSKTDNLYIAEEIFRTLGELEGKDPPRYLINTIREKLIRMKEVFESLVNINQTQIYALQRDVRQLYNNFHEIKIPTGSFPIVSDSHVQQPNPPSESNGALPAKHGDRILEIGRLVDKNKIREAIDLSNDIANTFEIYQSLYEERKHNFMKQSDTPDEIMQWIVSQIQNEDKFSEFRDMDVRVFELGPGLGNDAVQFVKGLSNLIGYHAIDAYEPGVNITRSRLDRLKDFGQAHSEFGHNIISGDFLKWMIDDRSEDHYPGDLPKHERLIVHSKSTGHYSLQPIFKQLFLSNLFRITWAGRGLLSLSMKTPESPTWREHIPIFRKQDEKAQDGYLCGIHKTEGQLRTFVTKEKLLIMLDEAGFDVLARNENGEFLIDENGELIISENASVAMIEVPGYDYDGQVEIFITVLARPKLIKNHI